MQPTKMCDTAKTMLRGRFIALNIYLKKLVALNISNLRFQLQTEEREEKKVNPKQAEKRMQIKLEEI